jgi:hypothetical protein
VHIIAWADYTRKHEAQKGQHKRSAKEDIRSIPPITVDIHQVTDVDSKTTVGCFSRRTTNTTLPATIVEEMLDDVLAKTIKQDGEAEDTNWEEDPTCLRLPKSEWIIKQDNTGKTKKLDEENTRIQTQGPGNGMPRSIKFALEKHKLDHNTDTDKQVWEEEGITSPHLEQKHINETTMSGLELCCTSLKEHVSKSRNSNKNCGTCKLIDKDNTK